MAVVVAVDAGTTGVRALAVDGEGRVSDLAYRELTQHFPSPGLVEHDAGEIFALVDACLADLCRRLAERSETVAAIGITNQRETAVSWDTTSGRPLGRALCWQDRRTSQRCEELEAAGHLAEIRARTGLVLDSYFSATKWQWMLENGAERSPRLALGTVDDWVLWNLTGGPEGGVHATDPSNASRTLCFDIHKRAWSEELCALFGVPIQSLGEVLPSSGRFGRAADHVAGGSLGGVPVSGIAGDQQAALFGQRCYEEGSVKVTYGTGSFVLMNAGSKAPEPPEGLLVTVAWEVLGRLVYALEGAAFVAGAALQWLRDGLGIVGDAAEAGRLAASVERNDGCYFVPALAGLGSPWWDPDARGLVIGISKGIGRGHLARAAVEAIAYQTRDILDSMTKAATSPPTSLRADGGAAAMDLLLQLQADQCRLPVSRGASTEVTALGAAFLAGLAEGFWSSLDELSGLPAGGESLFEPSPGPARADADHAGWLRAVERSRNWARR